MGFVLPGSRGRATACLVLAILLLAGCQRGAAPLWPSPPAVPTPTVGGPSGQVPSGGSPPPAGSVPLVRSVPSRSPIEPLLIPGRPNALPSASPGPIAEGEIELSLSGTDIRDAARAVLGELLSLPYAVDPQVQGQVTIETFRPIPRQDAFAVFEAALRPAGFALVERSGLITITSAATASRQGVTQGPGFGTEAIQLRHVSAASLRRLLEPVLQEGQLTQLDPSRNLLLVTGTAAERRSVRETVAQFDVDWLAGQSYGLFPVRSASARRVVDELGQVLGGEASPIAGLVRLVPLDRLNAVLAISPQPRYLEQVQAWIGRLDRESRTDERRVFVYRVQNGRSADLARVLARAFGVQADAGGRGRAATAQGLQRGGTDGSPFPTTSSSGQSGSPFGSASGNPFGGAGNSDQQGAAQSALQAAAGGDPLAAQAFALAAGASPDQLQPGAAISITSDEANNALVIVATSREQQAIEDALRRLDIIPLQVLIEAVVTEVTLTDDLRYGVQWFLRDGNASGVLNFQRANRNPDTGALLNILPQPTIPGFNFIYQASGIRAVLDALSSVTRINVVSSPQLLVLNNQTAALQVGDQVPIATQASQQQVTTGAPIVNSIELRDTGVILKVTPRVNESGLVLLDISQEVSDVVATTTSELNSPTIQQRRVASSVAVQDGETIALGGLIRDRRSNGRDGIPLLKDIPLLGNLFASTSTGIDRTELLILLTPRVIRGSGDARAATEELRRRIRGIPPIVQTRGQRFPTF